VSLLTAPALRDPDAGWGTAGGEERLRVAIVTETFLPTTNGVANSVARVAEHLCAGGHEALIVAPGPGADHHAATPVVRLRSVPLPRYADFPVGVPTPRLRAALSAFAPDVVHLAAPTLVGARALSVARDLGLPTVAVYQTDLVRFAAHYGVGHAAGGVRRWLRRVHVRADRTLAPSTAAAADLRRWGVPEVHRWGRGVDLARFSPAHRTRPPTAAVDVVRIGYVGRLASEKSVERLAYAADLPGTEVVVVGDGPQRRRLEQALPAARFLGQLSGAALSRAFADLDVFVHTGANETFCQAVQEALASGVPVVAPAAGGPLDLVVPGRNGLLWHPQRPRGIGGAVAALVADPILREDLGVAARRGVGSRTWSALGDELVDHYRAVIARSARGDAA
jgi:phosphatidylinositol alpha 1,6-mannosyltransferase